jgi:hypothetical protein
MFLITIILINNIVPWKVASVSNTSGLYLGSARFESRTGLTFSWLPEVSPGKFRNSSLELDHNLCLPNPLQLITECHR